jgi:hypothetical protein
MLNVKMNPNILYDINEEMPEINYLVNSGKIYYISKYWDRILKKYNETEILNILLSKEPIDLQTIYLRKLFYDGRHDVEISRALNEILHNLDDNNKHLTYTITELDKQLASLNLLHGIEDRK